MKILTVYKHKNVDVKLIADVQMDAVSIDDGEIRFSLRLKYLVCNLV